MLPTLFDLFMVNLTQRFNEQLCPQTIKISQKITSMY